MGWRETASGLIVPEHLELPEDSARCRVCGCTELEPCLLEGADPDGIDDTHCAWADGTRTLCTGCCL